MKKQQKFSRAAGIVALVTVLILLVPFVAMQFSTEVNWSVFDFLVMGVLIFGTGLAYVWLSRRSPGVLYRVAAALALVTTFLMIWFNLAVGLIGSGPNAANLMYMMVLPVLIAGAWRARLKPAGMERTLYGVSLLLVLMACIALFSGMQRHVDTSTAEILGISGFFAGLFFIAGLLYRFSALRRLPGQA